MNDVPRKKSPRAPTLALNEAIEGALKIYEKENRHVVPVDVAAQHLGYKSANNGAAAKALASIRYFGLLDRPQEGQLSVTKEVQEYQYAPSPELKQQLLRRWLKTPPVYAELLDKFQHALPSDGTLKYELIQRGFLPEAADSVLSVFRNSVDFARYYDVRPEAPVSIGESEAASERGSVEPSSEGEPRAARLDGANIDRIPVRLAGGRRAWLEIPTPFHEADKVRLKNQIDLLLTEEDEAAARHA